MPPSLVPGRHQAPSRQPDPRLSGMICLAAITAPAAGSAPGWTDRLCPRTGTAVKRGLFRFRKAELPAQGAEAPARDQEGARESRTDRQRGFATTWRALRPGTASLTPTPDARSDPSGTGRAFAVCIPCLPVIRCWITSLFRL